MKCQSCGKREATVKYMENINGMKQELHFCYDCAKKLGFVNFSDIFSPIFVTIPETKKVNIQKCGKCGYTFDEYVKNGVFGCGECYNAFSDRLDELLLKLHGKNRHLKINKLKAKKSNKNNVDTVDDKINKLKEELNDLVKAEEYEKAAVIRDKIKLLEEKRG